MSTETRAKYTPGPWLIQTESTSFNTEDHADKSHAITTADGWVIAEVCSDIYGSAAEANARLIAAAPELLEAAKEMLGVWNELPEVRWLGRHTPDKLRAAIAKAEGRE